jgi:uncharacterized iron-regulated protein
MPLVPRLVWPIGLVSLVVAAVLGACALDPTRNAPALLSAEQRAAGVLDPTDSAALDRLLDAAVGRRVVYLGEIHDRYDHHVNQLAVIRGLHDRGVRLAIGLEAFQAPYQRHLDDYLAGRIDETELLRRTEYYERWRFDFRLYRDVLRYARDNGIPLVALNAPTELVDAVSRKGIGGLSPAERALLPARIASPDKAYQERLRAAFRMHGGMPDERFNRFMEVQAVWDETMAGRGAEYLVAHPDRTLVVLVGSAHVLHDAAIPDRLRTRLPVEDLVVVTVPFEPLPGAEPDFVLAAREVELGPRGRTGLTLKEDAQGVRVAALIPKGAAEQAGVRVGDRVTRIGGVPIADLADVRLSLTDSAPGDRLRVELKSTDSGQNETKLLTLL